MTSNDMGARYALRNKPDDKLIGIVIDELLQHGWTYDQDPIIDYYHMTYLKTINKLSKEKEYQNVVIHYNKSNDLDKKVIKLAKLVKLIKPLEISECTGGGRLNEIKLGASIHTGPVEYLGEIDRSEITIHIEFPPWSHLADQEISNWTVVASKLWNRIALFNEITTCCWLVFSTSCYEELATAKIGWITIFPPEIARKIGIENLMKAPAWKIEKIAEDTVMVVICRNPVDSDRFEKIEKFIKYIDPKNELLGK